MKKNFIVIKKKKSYRDDWVESFLMMSTDQWLSTARVSRIQNSSIGIDKMFAIFLRHEVGVSGGTQQGIYTTIEKHHCGASN